MSLCWFAIEHDRVSLLSWKFVTQGQALAKGYLHSMPLSSLIFFTSFIFHFVFTSSSLFVHLFYALSALLLHCFCTSSPLLRFFFTSLTLLHHFFASSSPLFHFFFFMLSTSSSLLLRFFCMVSSLTRRVRKMSGNCRFAGRNR